MNKLYNFTIGAYEWGDTPEEAWEVCKENFNIDEESLPDYEIVDEDEQSER